MKNDLLRILKGSIVTDKSGIFYLDLYTERHREVNNYELIKSLIVTELLDFESGNCDTRERHYILHTKYVSYKDNIRYVNLKKFTKKLNNYSYMIVSDRIKNVYFSLKNSIERKQKLEKLNEK